MVGRQEPGEDKEHKLLPTEQADSGKSAQAALGGSLNPELCQVALVTLHGVELAQGPDAPALLDRKPWCQ